LHDRLQRLAIALNRWAVVQNDLASELHDRLQQFAIALNRWAVVQLT